MEPLPGPSLMLPALDLSGSPDLDHNTTYKRREAQWKRLVSSLHREWCLCGSFLNHFILPPNSLIKCTEEGSDMAAAEDIIPGGDGGGGGADSIDVDGDPDAG
nr:ORF2 [Torque teno felis virus]